MQIKGKFDHFNINVMDLGKSMAFYQKALCLTEKRRREAEDGSYTLVFMGDEHENFFIELTWLRGRKEPYNLGDNESHLCVRVDGDYDAIREFHREMGCICFENKSKGLYFIEDPDGYWIEIVKRK